MSSAAKWSGGRFELCRSGSQKCGRAKTGERASLWATGHHNRWSAAAVSSPRSAAWKCTCSLGCTFLTHRKTLNRPAGALPTPVSQPVLDEPALLNFSPHPGPSIPTPAALRIIISHKGVPRLPCLWSHPSPIQPSHQHPGMKTTIMPLLLRNPFPSK